MSAAEHRRNGKVASCEPCRKAKIRCDHQRPVCGRCQRRELTARCYYHPAPLTKPRPSEYDPPVPSWQPTPRRPAAPPSRSQSERPAPVSEFVESPSVLPWPPTTPEFHARVPQPAGGIMSEDPSHEDKVKIVKQVLADFRRLDFIRDLLEEYGNQAQSKLAPRPFTDHFSASLVDLVGHCFNGDKGSNDVNLTRVAEKVIRNTTKDIKITSNTDFASFVSMFSGENFRLETIGLLQCLAARACSFGLARDDYGNEDFVLALYRNTASCLRLSRHLATDNNDVMIWLGFEYVRCTTHIEGDTSPPVYRRVGDLATSMYEFGLQRESSVTRNTPFFIQECRRQVFAAAYHFDKFLSALVDRPPRILRRFSDVRMPLELTDEELFESKTEDQARTNLTADGWNLRARYIPTTWPRLRYMLGAFREEVQEFHYRQPSVETEALLKDISQRCKLENESLPAHVRYSPECWDTDMIPSVCLMLTVIHLSYLEVDFEVHRLLEKCDPRHWEASVTLALEIVSVLLHVGTRLNRANGLRYDFPYMVLGYGLPCVAFLTGVLQSISRSGGTQSLPPNIKRATLLRKLSVYVSHLDSICRPKDGDYNICMQASKAISRVLDEVLDPSSASTEATATNGILQTPVSATAGGESQQTAAFSSSQQMMVGADDFDLLNVDGLEGFDLSSWVKNIDWTSTGYEWSTF